MSANRHDLPCSGFILMHIAPENKSGCEVIHDQHAKTINSCQRRNSRFRSAKMPAPPGEALPAIVAEFLV